jgi:hypothetical protein
MSRTFGRPLTDEDMRVLRQMLEDLDPDVAAAVDDVDRSLIAISLDQTPLERVVSANAGYAHELPPCRNAALLTSQESSAC